MQIPNRAQTLGDFVSETANVIKSPNTYIYIDTSFLVWLAKLGHSARDEFFRWTHEIGETKFFVPAWASHEFTRHYVQKLIPSTLTKTANDLEKTADNTYSFIRPFLDIEIDTDLRSSDEVKVEVRDALIKLKGVAASIKKLRNSNLDLNFEAVIDFINANCIRSGDLFNYLKDIGDLEKNRFSGRIPPGFQDKRKQDGESDGGNRYGDLIFWYEIIEHAKQKNRQIFGKKIKSIVILTNDRKNDWHMGGEDTPEIDKDLLQIRKSWDPIPRTHPMLEFEASNQARIDKVYLLDSSYLALTLQKVGAGNKFDKFIDSALSVELPNYSEKSRRKSVATEAPQRAEIVQKPSRVGQSVAGINVEPFPLMKSFITSKLLDENVAKRILDSCIGTEQSSIVKSIVEQLNGEPASLSRDELVKLSRHLYLIALQNKPLAKDHLIDLISQINTFENDVACCLYLGLLAGMYFDNQNHVQLPPSNLALSQVLSLQSFEHLSPAIQAVNKKINQSVGKPAYIPNYPAPTLNVQVIAKTSSLERLQKITGLVIGNASIVTESQGDSTYLFSNIFSKQEITLDELIEAGCAYFAVPRTQLDIRDNLDTHYTFGPQTGFESPTKSFNC